MTTGTVRSPAAIRQIIAGVFLFYVATNFMLPTVPTAVRGTGGDELAVGVAMAAGSLTALATRLVWPLLGRRVPRAWLLLVGSGAMALTLVAFAAAGTVSAIIALRVCGALAMSCFITVAAGTAADLAPEGRRGEVMGNYASVVPIALVVGLGAGGLIVNTAGVAVAFLTAGACALLCLLTVASLLRHPEVGRPDTSPSQGLWPPGARVPAAVLLLLTGANAAVIAFGPPALAGAGLDSIGAFFVVYALSFVVAARFAGRLGDRLGHRNLALVGVSLIAVGVISLGAAPWSGTALVGVLLFGVGLGTASPNVVAFAVDQVSGGRAAVMGLLLVGQDIGITVMTPLMGWVSEGRGPRTSMTLLIVPVACAGLILLTLAGARTRSPRP